MAIAFALHENISQISEDTMGAQRESKAVPLSPRDAAEARWRQMGTAERTFLVYCIQRVWTQARRLPIDDGIQSGRSHGAAHQE